ncbi:hypothetical protein SFR_0966 [Streptomyces sp. FR-008]|nr:hypothetical protein SFR_0966 [Streptomyces sp. FR-008]
MPLVQTYRREHRHSPPGRSPAGPSTGGNQPRRKPARAHHPRTPRPSATVAAPRPGYRPGLRRFLPFSVAGAPPARSGRAPAPARTGEGIRRRPPSRSAPGMCLRRVVPTPPGGLPVGGGAARRAPGPCGVRRPKIPLPPFSGARRGGQSRA